MNNNHATDRRSSLRPIIQDIVVWLRANPLALMLSAVILVMNCAVWAVEGMAGAHFPPDWCRISFDRLMEGHLYTVPLSLLFVAHPLRLLLDVPAVLLAGGYAESRLGRIKSAWVALICATGGIATGMGVSVMVNGHSPLWQHLATLGFVLGPLTLVFGPLMAASAFTSVLWKRRIRIIGYALAAMLVLYRGETGDWCVFAAALFGHLLGYLMASRHAKPGHLTFTMLEARRITAVVVAVMALGPLIAVTSPIHAGPLSTLGLLMGDDAPDTTRLASCLSGETSIDCYNQYRLARVWMPGNVLVSLLPVAFMLVVAYGLYRGRRLAAWAGIVVNAGIVMLSVLYFLVFPLGTLSDDMAGLVMHGALRSMTATVLPSLCCIIMIAGQMRRFPLHTRNKLVAITGVVVLIWGALLSVVYLAAGITHPDWFTDGVTIWGLLKDLPDRFLPIGFLNAISPDFLPVAPAARALYQGIGSLLWVAMIAGLLFCMLDRSMIGERSQREASHLVELGGESMSFMATWQGNTYWFSASGRSAIAYRVAYGVALTVAGPFGDPAEWRDDLRDFIRFCAEHSWTPVFYSVHVEQRDLLVSHGWKALDVGTEMVLDPRAWQTRGKKWQDVRTAINKAKREGVVDMLATYGELPLAVQSQIVDISEQWVGEKALPEMKFTLGGVQELHDPRVRILYAQDADGLVQGVTSWLPTWRDGHIVGWTLDFMRHRPDSKNGVMEFLIARMAERLRDEGEAEFMSLSAAPLAGLHTDAVQDDRAQESDGSNDSNVNTDVTPDTADSLFLPHVLEAVADVMEPVYGFHSLLRFKEKFQPQAHPVYIVYPDAAKLAQIALATVHAYLPDMRPKDVFSFVRALR
ncbi:bifunctional lysylphosphatidylglycerol flippase/synthetase MprF [Bifidobacterium oedipodis]|uniref:Phosphatidylglycerol lysyltransferase C-terminal domain-containing protein n=1 Tax=Bifidobacterium oedipodis TaxID=2675322 RepID=A0A7Y0HT90_9BIFI|nr:DUF2156 domain-containing protein [Bifidobacterium sp. DSM 109957]NMM94368.1 hypothetical protein [Bifidobacterium sp. DSM 109957]